MSKRRSTVDVAVILEKANKYLALGSGLYGPTPDQRLGVASLLETILHDTGNYAGYNLLGWMNGGYDAWVADGKPASTAAYLGDDSRRFYYTKNAPATRKANAEKGFHYPKAI
jgi:hypothetical protein